MGYEKTDDVVQLNGAWFIVKTYPKGAVVYSGMVGWVFGCEVGSSLHSLYLP